MRRLNPVRPRTQRSVVDRTGRIATRQLPTALESVLGMAGVRWALAVGSGIGGILYPSPTGVSTIPDFDTPEERAARQIRAAIEDARRVVDSPSIYDQDRIRRGELPEFPSDPREGPVPMREATREPTEFGQRVLDAALSGNVYDRDWLRDQIARAVTGDRQLEDYGPPEPEGEELYEYTPTPQVSAPPTMPPPQTVTPAPAPRGGNVVRRIVGAMSNPAARYAVIGLGVVGALQARRRGGGAQTAVLNRAGDAITTPPATVGYPYVGSYPLTRFDAGSVSSSRTSSCSCSPKKRGPKRKCLERGSVAWRTGRFKGRTAGTKCIRYARS